MKPDPEVIEKLVRQIIEIAHPLRIILFGSAARGEMGPDSDLDVLVVMPDGTQQRKAMLELYRRISGIGVPYDILVTTPSILETHKHNIGLIYQNILAEGKDIYAA